MKMNSRLLLICSAIFGALVLNISQALAAPNPALLEIQANLESASLEFDIPTPLLKAIAYVESHWQQVIPDTHEGHGHQMIYGVMGLRSDDWFGHSLTEAAGLIHQTEEVLRIDPKQNIRGGAAFLKSKATATLNARSPLHLWADAVALYTGIPDAQEQALYLQDVWDVLKNGVDSNGIKIDPVQCDTPLAVLAAETEIKPLGVNTEYPDATWDPSPNITPGANTPKFVVIHVTEGNFAGAVSWLKSPKSNVSAHYVIRSRDGLVKQLVKSTDKAWHVRCWNPVTIGIEHEGFIDQPEYFTPEMYLSSAKLTRYLVDSLNIPDDNLHVFGHDFWTKKEFDQSPIAPLGKCQTHTDPGPNWDWKGYLSLVQSMAHPNILPVFGNN